MPRLTSLSGLTALTVLLALTRGAFPLSAADQSDAMQRGLCYSIDAANGELHFIPLESTEVVLDVKPGLLEAEVIQTFSNRTDAALEAIYRYPLPSEATLTEFELQYPDHVVRSIVREKGEARVVYETAKSEGKKAALLEQHDPSLFSTSVANFLPGETVRAVIRFIQPLSLAAGAVEVRFPMVTGEKYFPVATPPGTSGAASENPEHVAADSVSPKHVYAFDIEVAGFPTSAIKSPSHAIRVESANGGGCFRVALAEEITVPDRDFILRIETNPEAVLQPTLVTEHTETGDYGLLTFFPPFTRSTSAHAGRSRDVLFMIDRSGSMQGRRFASAQLGLEGCIRALLPEDRLQIISFNDLFASFRPTWAQADSTAIDDAVHYVRELWAGGGTEMLAALETAFSAFEQNDREKIMIFLTDGDVGNEDALLNLVETRIRDVRLFTFGIGAAPNSDLIQKMADLGRGQARFISDDNSIERELVELFNTFDSPVLSDVRVSLVDASGAAIEHVAFPERVSNVFAGRPIQTIFRATARKPAAVLIEGSEDSRPVTHRIALATEPTRGHGLEKHFGSRSYGELATELRKSKIEDERIRIRKEMLETALLFQLVTEQTSRVAIDSKISRDPNASLETIRVAQYSAADDDRGSFVRVEADGSETVVLSPFSVSTEGDGYYATSTLAGTRLNTSLRDMSSSITVVTRELIEDVAALRPEDILAFTMEPEDRLDVSRSSANAGLLGGLPIATVVDPATVDRITMQSNAPATKDLSQVHATGRASTTLTSRIGDEGIAGVSLDSAFSLDAVDSMPMRAIVSWAHLGHDQWGIFIDANKRFGGDKLSGTAQWRALNGYGAMHLYRAAFEHRFGSMVTFEATVAHHELRRDNALQFRRDSSTARYDGLGFFNLDLLTAETRRLTDSLLQAQLSGEVRGAFITQTWSARALLHTQKSDWASADQERSTNARRDNRTFEFDYVAGLAGDRIHVTANVGWSHLHGSRGFIDDKTTRNTALGLNGPITEHLNLFANTGHEEFQPWLPTVHVIESRRNTQAGVRANLWSDRLTGFVNMFRENASNVVFRDWAQEQANAAFGATPLAGAPVSYGVLEKQMREGWMASVDFNPTRSWICTASCTWGSNIDGPYRGGNRRASLASRYEFFGGMLRGLRLGLSLSATNTTTFHDGYTLPGGVRGDLMFGRRMRRADGHETIVQLNLLNATNRSWQPTRFSNDRGRQVILSLSDRF